MMALRTRTHVRTGQAAPGIPGSPVLYTYDFTSSPSIPATLTHTRASTGWSFDSSGVLQSYSTNVARFDYVYNGSLWVPGVLLVEPQRTNLANPRDVSSWS